MRCRGPDAHLILGLGTEEASAPRQTSPVASARSRGTASHAATVTSIPPGERDPEGPSRSVGSPRIPQPLGPLGIATMVRLWLWLWLCLQLPGKRDASGLGELKYPGLGWSYRRLSPPHSMIYNAMFSGVDTAGLGFTAPPQCRHSVGRRRPPRCPTLLMDVL